MQIKNSVYYPNQQIHKIYI